jgi:hypothetical protein
MCRCSCIIVVILRFDCIFFVKCKFMLENINRPSITSLQIMKHICPIEICFPPSPLPPLSLSQRYCTQNHTMQP